MPQLPFNLPKSLVSYAEYFREDPLNTTVRLKQQLKKRGPDAVGHFLLAWFYHMMGRSEEAIEQAIKAKIYAPGSPFFEKLHYYLVHPDSFEAWTPQTTPADYNRSSDGNRDHGPVLNLDALIEKLAEVESARISLSPDKIKDTDHSLSKNPDETDDIASDTLANIHEAQGKTEAAIRTYKRLKKLNKEKKDFYKEKISALKRLQKKHPDEEE